MDPINPWLDPGETRRLAERLRGPARQWIAAPEDAGFDDSFVGFSQEAPPPATSTTLSSPSPIETQREIPVHPAPDTPATASCPQFGWLSEQFGASGHFMLDAQGGLLCNDGPYQNYQFIARELARSSTSNPHVRVRILANALLEVIPVQTPKGINWLGVVVPTALTPEALRQIHLRWSVDGVGEGSP